MAWPCRPILSHFLEIGPVVIERVALRSGDERGPQICIFLKAFATFKNLGPSKLVKENAVSEWPGRSGRFDPVCPWEKRYFGLY